MLRGLVIAALFVIEILLGIRLIIPFTGVPRVLVGWVPLLLQVTDFLMAPFKPLFTPFALDSLRGGSPTLAADVANQIDPAVVVAMVGWAVVAAFLAIVLGLLGRATQA
jgi:hypothetical protein